MGAATNDLTLEHGADFVRTLVIRDSVDDVVDLSSGTPSDFAGEIRRSRHGHKEAEFTVAYVTDGTDGTVSLTLLEEAINLLDVDKKYEYDLFWTMPSGIRTKLLKGDVSVAYKITQS